METTEAITWTSEQTDTQGEGKNLNPGENPLQPPRTYSDEWTESEWFRVWLRLAHGQDPDGKDEPVN